MTWWYIVVVAVCLRHASLSEDQRLTVFLVRLCLGVVLLWGVIELLLVVVRFVSSCYRGSPC